MQLARLATCAVILMAPALLWPQNVTGPTVRFRTTEGDIDVLLLPAQAQRTVQNFLNYVNKGAFENSFVHRSVPGFIWQGGGYRFRNGRPEEIPQDPPVVNEFRVSNTRGTLAMAKLDGNPNSATNQWFFNLGDNSRNLNAQNGGFTVFGRVANDASLAVMDRIAAIRPVNAGAPFDQIPLVNYSGGALQEANLVRLLAIEQVDAAPGPVITGVQSASGFGALPHAAPGSYIEIYGTNLSGDVRREWAAADFNNGLAPTNLEGTSVTAGGLAAFVNYVSPTLVNVQLPANVATGGTVGIVVTVRGQASAPFSLPTRAVAPGLLAPVTFKVNDRQYVVAIQPATRAFVSNGNIPGIPAAPANPGDTLLFFGTGFGAVSPGSVPIAGRISNEAAAIVANVRFRIAERDAAVGYAGLAPGVLGLYQFNVTLPDDLPGGDVPLQLVVNGEPTPQTLFLSIRER